MPTALITGASRGLGAALTHALLDHGWSVLADARDGDALGRQHARHTPDDSSGWRSGLFLRPGDVTDGAHRDELVRTVTAAGRLDLLVNNASLLGPSPLRPVAELTTSAFRAVLDTNVLAPQALTRALLPILRRNNGMVLNISSDAAVEPYPTWGAYGASKAALEQLTRILAAEEPDLAVYAIDPGDMRTTMHQAAFPDEDISDRPDPAAVVPALLLLLRTRPPSGRYRASDLPALVGTGQP
jgi:NAD(P)-dependent dehydrogenase (short-subunit alcohol dehydrogenase family)